MFRRIKDLRVDKDLYQKDVADVLNVTQATYSRYESGDLDIPIHALIKLAEFYNVTVDFLVEIDVPKE